MPKTEAYKIVLDELKTIPLFCGKYDAKNGNSSFMNGICTVMEFIAKNVSDDELTKYETEFTNNIIVSKESVNSAYDYEEIRL